jgi:hypothetical protein
MYEFGRFENVADTDVGGRTDHHHSIPHNRRCFGHSTGNGLAISRQVIASGCFPSSIISTISGASSVNRITLATLPTHENFFGNFWSIFDE